MNQIESYKHTGEGFNPFLIRDGWQVAQLNYVSGQGLDDIRKIDVHPGTDEVFILMAGKAVLITADRQEHTVRYEMVVMKPGVIYNIPKGVWHNIAMYEDAQVILVENANTHQADCVYYYLDEMQQKDLYRQIAKAITAEP